MALEQLTADELAEAASFAGIVYDGQPKPGRAYRLPVLFNSQQLYDELVSSGVLMRFALDEDEAETEFHLNRHSPIWMDNQDGSESLYEGLFMRLEEMPEEGTYPLGTCLDTRAIRQAV
ncbi:hypothetical protein [Ferrimonas marina]|uniref:Uncharacterized protein n=1 Tax=Ferrimonas marina TaxID=299255 RepID=A0A1M5TVC0_9GAMM|nr:hypothetical protein [Ferrimonas marina]SHH54727.1 hypothetical protein SAMN02745129_2293 [Ferrimonas marina]